MSNKNNKAEGKLIISVIEAKALKAVDFGGTSDPYVVVDVGDMSKKTKYISKNLNPSWNEQFELCVQCGDALLMTMMLL